jgi:hypothetical protein
LPISRNRPRTACIAGVVLETEKALPGTQQKT